MAKVLCGYLQEYFQVALSLYVLGLVITVVVNKVTGAAQPALLYLVPSVLGGTSIYAAVKGNLDTLFAYRDPKSQTEAVEATEDAS